MPTLLPWDQLAQFYTPGNAPADQSADDSDASRSPASDAGSLANAALAKGVNSNDPRAIGYAVGKAKTSQGKKTTTTIAPDPQEEQKSMAVAQMLRDSNDAYQGQKQGLQANQDMISKFMQGPAAPNYQPMAQFFDYLTDGKTHYADSMPRPLTPEERQIMGIKLSGELQKERSQFSGLDSRLTNALLIRPAVQALSQGGEQSVEGGTKPLPRVDHYPDQNLKSQREGYEKATAGLGPLLKYTQDLQAELNKPMPPQSAGLVGGAKNVAQKVSDSVFGPGTFVADPRQARLDALKARISTDLEKGLGGVRGVASPSLYSRIAGMYGNLPFSDGNSTRQGLSEILQTIQEEMDRAKTTYPDGAAQFGGQALEGRANTISMGPPKSQFVPKTDAELKAMTPEQKKAYVEQLRSGQKYGR